MQKFQMQVQIWNSIDPTEADAKGEKENKWRGGPQYRYRRVDKGAQPPSILSPTPHTLTHG